MNLINVIIILKNNIITHDDRFYFLLYVREYIIEIANQ